MLCVTISLMHRPDNACSCLTHKSNFLTCKNSLTIKYNILHTMCAKYVSALHLIFRGTYLWNVQIWAGRGVTLITHVHLVPRSRICMTVPSPFICACMVCTGVILPLPMPLSYTLLHILCSSIGIYVFRKFFQRIKTSETSCFGSRSDFC
jgi:hypothetical protein